MLNRLKHKIKEKIYAIIPPPPVNETFSQAGEDACLDFLFTTMKIERITYLELGVYKPKTASNTYRFYQKGSTGVLVEADATLIPEIRKARPKDKTLNCGVGIGDLQEADFYVFEEPAHSTFSNEEAEFRSANGSYPLKGKVKVKLKNINNILKEEFTRTPELLSIDIEGLDFPVLQTLDFERFPIPVICAETCTYSENHLKPKNNSIAQFMKSKGYFIYADTYINTIFVNEKWFLEHQPK